jgi:hypothetical protein
MKSHPFFKYLNAGFGLTEAMLAAGLMGGIALMTAKLSSEMNKSAKGTEVKFEYQSLHADIRAWLTNEDSAYATFQGTDLTTCNGNSNAAAPATCQVASIKYPIGSATSIKWQAGSYSNFGTSGKNNGYTTANLIEIDSAWLSNYVKNSAATTAGQPGTGEVILNIRYENLGFKTRAAGTQYTLKQIPIRVTVDGGDVTTGAVASSGSGSSQWLDLADMTGIYYAAGGVRIGASGKVYDGASFIMGTSNTTMSANSGAMGTSNYVSGLSSFAIGHGSIAATSTGSSGSGGPMSSIAIGRGNTASGSEATAIGYGNVATDRFSMALGTASWSLGVASMTLGSWAMATGQNSLATGYYSESHGFASNSFGSYTKANASGSMTFGDFSTSTYMVNNQDNSLMARFAKGYSFITEINSTPTQGLFIRPGGNLMVGDSNAHTSGATTASNSLGVGQNNILASQSSAAIGAANTVGGGLALALGYQNKVGLVGTPQGWSSLAIGAGNSVSGAKSVAIGWNNSISGDNSFAVGAASMASAHYALALGVRASAIDSGATVMSGYPAASFNINSNARVHNTGEINAAGSIVYAANKGCSGLVPNCSVGGPDSFTARFRGGYRFYTSDPGASVPTTGVFLGPSASAWGSISDKTKKEDFEEIDGEELLAKIAGLEIVKWKYIGSTHQHLGPMAQDFYEAFKLGDGNNTVITTQDIEGVTIAGVQALEKRTKELQKENDDLKKRIERLEALILKSQN